MRCTRTELLDNRACSRILAHEGKMKSKALIVTSALRARTGILASRLARVWSTLFVLMAVVNCSSSRAVAQAADSPARISVPGSNGVFEITVGSTEWNSVAEPDGKEVSLEAMRRPDA